MKKKVISSILYVILPLLVAGQQRPLHNFLELGVAGFISNTVSSGDNSGKVKLGQTLTDIKYGRSITINNRISLAPTIGYTASFGRISYRIHNDIYPAAFNVDYRALTFGGIISYTLKSYSSGKLDLNFSADYALHKKFYLLLQIDLRADSGNNLYSIRTKEDYYVTNKFILKPSVSYSKYKSKAGYRVNMGIKTMLTDFTKYQIDFFDFESGIMETKYYRYKFIRPYISIGLLF